MKIILSRKGFDSTTGGFPSPIFEDGNILSLPIPYKKGIPYGSVSTGLPEFGDMGSVVEKLTNDRVRANSTAHLDPDLNLISINRAHDWRGAFGQSSSQQSHLDKNQVDSGDLFLFFGLFRRVEGTERGTLRFIKGEPRKHVILGWLNVDQRYLLPNKSDEKVSLAGLPAWAKYHPHVEHYCIEPKPNALYTAKAKLVYNSDIPGWGLFPKYKDKLCLSYPNPPKNQHGNGERPDKPMAASGVDVPMGEAR